MKIELNKPCNMHGLFVVFEGIDGSGKSSICERVHSCLGWHSLSILNPKRGFEPTRGMYGKFIRDNLGKLSATEELSYFLLDRAQNKEQFIQPTLDNDGTIFLDRYFYSNLVYQSLGDIDINLILNLNKPVIINPDLVLILDVAVNTALDRIDERGNNTAYEKHDFLTKARAIYNSFEAPNIQIIDANQSFDTVCANATRLIKEAHVKKKDLQEKYLQLVEATTEGLWAKLNEKIS